MAEANSSVPRRRSRRRAGGQQDVPTRKRTKSKTKAKRSQLWQDRLNLGIAGALRDRILQHKSEDGKVPKSMKQALHDVNKTILKLRQQLSHNKATVADVYHVLDTEFADCPWPLPPSAILKYLPVDEDPPGTHKRRNSESVLRNMITQGRRLKACSDWEFRDAGSRPEWTYFDEATEYRHKPQRAYAFQKGKKEEVSRVRWYQFLHGLTRTQLDAGARMLQSSDVSDLGSVGMSFLEHLRNYHDVLLMPKESPFLKYRECLRRLHELGILNLSLTLVGTRKLPLHQLVAQREHQVRSLSAQLREARKKVDRKTMCAENFRKQAVRAEAALTETQKKLRLASARLLSFAHTNPEWNPPPGRELLPVEHEDARHIFEEVDKNLDLDAQMKADPSGALTVFWQEQRRMLRAKKGTQWNPQVLRYCFFRWSRMGKSNFDKLRDVLVLPSDRTLRMFKAKHIPQGGGVTKSILQSLRQKFDEEKIKCDDVILSWDATGYGKHLFYNKISGELEGFVCDPESFSMHQMFANKVNCFYVTSPEKDIKIKFPVAYYHTTSLDSSMIRQQWLEVMIGLQSIGLNVIAMVCDGASEHSRFLNLILDKMAENDPTISVRLGEGLWIVSDPPHLIKKFRNNWMSSGQSEFHTRNMCHGGQHIIWKIVEATLEFAVKLPNGDLRSPRALPKLILDAIFPSCIQKLRVKLAVRVFTQDVQDFMLFNKVEIAQLAYVRVTDVEKTVEFMSKVNELFNIMNSRVPISWCDKDDGTGTGNVIGFRNKCWTNRGFTLRKYSDVFGVSVKSLMESTGLSDPLDKPPTDSLLYVDRLDRLLKIADWFKQWRSEVYSTEGLNGTQKGRMFITHWLYDDLRRTCHSVVELCHKYLKGTDRKWVLKRFNQDPIESTFGQIRNLSGNNRDLNYKHVDSGIAEIRALGLETTKLMRNV